ncbi:NAD-dependent epimerase/dehydratase family protein [Paraburkholderia sediminicola]|uniref:NAD-dependent epimerase/dehydratase family protein n=1 Tax=Paraburkholderia sediminicola TaxID=458836 RepID=UPI0038B76A7B
MNCLVFGGAGFLGKHLCRKLIDAGHQVRVFDRAGRAVPDSLSDCEWVAGDFTNPQDISAALRDCEVVFHLVSATQPKASNENPVFDIEANLIATLRMLEAARLAGTRRVVFASSGGTVYGNPRILPIPEEHPTDPLCSYGIGKLAIEKYLHLYKDLHGIDYRVLRIANPYGEGQEPHAQQGAIAVFSYKALKDETITVWGDGSVVRDYLHVGDVADAMVRAMGHAGPHNVFNIGSGCGYSVNELLNAIERSLGRPVRRAYLPGRSFDVSKNVLDITRAKEALQWGPQICLEDGLQRTLQWLASRSC